MRRGITLGIILLLLVFNLNTLKAQTTSASSFFVAQPIPDRSVYFGVADAGVSKPITFGLDLAWLSEGNVRRGVAFMGADRVGLVRSSFTPTAALVNGDLATSELATLNERIRIINTFLGTNTKVVLNCDHPSVDASFSGNAANWAALIDVTTRRHQEAGRTVVTVSPFNEPDNTAVGQGTVTDFYNICGVLKSNSRFANISICGGNTLNNDNALTWYNTLKDRLDEGNTHQLAGTFDNYATFYQTVRANSDYAINDELHNVMEAMVGVEYGLQAGIWWGTAEYARGEFCKASDGVRLGYAEHRTNWTAASVYRNLDGKVQAFAGMSERQSATTTYRYVSKDRDVFYDGNGPQREYTLVMPGGAVGSYQNGQSNGERVVNITWGEDIQPVINGKYILVNRNSGKVLQAAGGSAVAGTNLVQSTNISGTTYQQWNVTPVDSRIGGDFSYFSFINVSSSKSFDLLNWSLDNGGNIIQYDDSKGANQQWYLEYAGDGWFYIRSRHSAKCIDVYNSGTADGTNICQWDKNGGTNQQWRLIPIDAAVEFVAPAAPTNLVATAYPESVKLTWTANTESDLAGYTIFRSSTAGGTYTTIARNITSTSFVDNTVTTTGTYYYKIKAVDKSLNRSAYSSEVSATTTGSNDLVAQYPFESNTLDNSQNLNHGATYGTISYGTGKVGSKAITLNGTDAFVQLPATLANQQNITVATWVYWNGGSTWQRIFDFGNDQTQYMFLTPKSGAGVLRFVINNGAGEQGLEAPALTSGVWSHVAVTMGTAGVTMYVNGVQVATSTAITIRPTDFKPILNYIGRSQFSDPLFSGSIDDFRVYNYALSASEIAQIAGVQTITFNDFSPVFVGDADSAIPATASSGLALTYTSSNTAVATIVSGNIHVVAAGTSTITATQAGNASYLPATATKTLTVYPIAPGTYKIICRTGGKCLDNLGATANTSGVAQWTSGSSENQQWVVSLVSGYYKFQCVTGGLYLDSNGNTADGSSVTENILWNGATTQDWTISPTGSYYKIINRANGKCVDNAGITTDGAYMKFYGSGSSYNQQWTFTRLKSMQVETPVNNPSKENVFAVYPNPATSTVTINFPTDAINLSIIDLQGRVVISKSITASQMNIDISSLNAGLYLIKVATKDNILVEKLIKK